jgi:hypothetical protein
MAKKKKKRVIDQLFNGMWNNLDYTQSTKNVFINSGIILLLGAAASIVITKRK